MNMWEDEATVDSAEAASEQDKAAASVTSDLIKERVREVEKDAHRLCSVIEQVTAQLASRTSRAAQITVAHSATTDELAGIAVSKMTRLQETSGAFLTDIRDLKSSFDVIKTLAQQTSEVRVQVMRLEAQVAKLAAKKQASAVVQRARP